jgi:hypothetical protein
MKKKITGSFFSIAQTKKKNRAHTQTKKKNFSLRIEKKMGNQI